MATKTDYKINYFFKDMDELESKTFYANMYRELVKEIKTCEMFGYPTINIHTCGKQLEGRRAKLLACTFLALKDEYPKIEINLFGDRSYMNILKNDVLLASILFPNIDKYYEVTYPVKGYIKHFDIKKVTDMKEA